MPENRLYFGDNLKILREHIPDESVGLIYLDPPFNSKATYNVLFNEKNGSESTAQITAFEDTWHWGLESERTYHEIVTKASGKLSDLIQAFRSFLGQNDMMAYLAMMAIRLIELHRVLKSNGSIYLHCDPTASHYLKLIMDSVFGVRNFRNEIVWCYKLGGRPRKGFPKKHDIILLYTKTDDFVFFSDTIRVPYESDGGYVKSGRKIVGGKVYRVNPLGKVPEDWWFISPLNRQSKERLGYPTQKPEELLNRIIKASSDDKNNNVVLDPFCGCGTTVAVAERLDRQWIGIDITHLAISAIQRRLYDTFGSELSPHEVIGIPKDLKGAEALANESRDQFEIWGIGLVKAQAFKRGPDSGIDGVKYFFDDNSGKAKKIIVQVKSGHVTVSQIRDLRGVLEREKAVIGVFITLKEPTKPMLTEAASTGFYEPEYIPNKRYPRLQILTIKELFEGKKVEYYRDTVVTFKKAKRKPKKKQVQTTMLE